MLTHLAFFLEECFRRGQFFQVWKNAVFGEHVSHVFDWVLDGKAEVWHGVCLHSLVILGFVEVNPGAVFLLVEVNDAVGFSSSTW